MPPAHPSSFILHPSSFRVAVIGGGFAGMAAALELAEGGAAVQVFEAAPVLGGRARRITYQGLDLDNGAHILLGAYRETLRLMRVAGVPAEALLKQRLRLIVDKRFHLAAPRLPAPLHLLVALLCARGLSLRQRLAAVRFMITMRRAGFRLMSDTTVAALLAGQGQQGAAVKYLWEPLCVAALNTPPDTASAQVFLAVLRDAFARRAENSDLLLPRIDLSRLFPVAAAKYVRGHGGTIRLLAQVVRIEREARGYSVCCGKANVPVDAVIVAAGPRQAARLIAPLPELSVALALIECFSYEPICTVYLQYAGSVALPAPMFGVAGGMAQWLFDRQALHGQTGLLAAVISAADALEDSSNADISTTIAAEIAHRFPQFGAPLWSKVVTERFATFACTPGLRRPPQATPLRRFYLAGDYTAGEYPATLEAAVQSGVKCARLLLDDMAHGHFHAVPVR